MSEYPITIPTDPSKPAHIRECYCDTCGLVAPSWFHRDFILHGHGFTCIWCSMPHIAEGERPVEWGYVRR